MPPSSKLAKLPCGFGWGSTETGGFDLRPRAAAAPPSRARNKNPPASSLYASAPVAWRSYWKIVWPAAGASARRGLVRVSVAKIRVACSGPSPSPLRGGVFFGGVPPGHREAPRGARGAGGPAERPAGGGQVP